MNIVIWACLCANYIHGSCFHGDTTNNCSIQNGGVAGSSPAVNKRDKETANYHNYMISKREDTY